jgi:enoyl-CoA hydratase
MNYTNILSQTDGAICTITINRPDKLNALNIETVRELGSAVKAAINDSAVRGIIITGSGPKAFVAGADIAEFKDLGPNEAEAMAQSGHDTFNMIENSPKPIIAAVNGFALGGGCELAMACHIRIASSNAKFGQPEINLGLIPGYGGTQRLVRLIGRGRATELLLTGDMFGAEEAKTLGLVNYVVEADSLLPKCKEILDKVSQKSPLVVRQLLKTRQRLLR